LAQALAQLYRQLCARVSRLLWAGMRWVGL